MLTHAPTYGIVNKLCSREANPADVNLVTSPKCKVQPLMRFLPSEERPPAPINASWIKLSPVVLTIGDD